MRMARCRRRTGFGGALAGEFLRPEGNRAPRVAGGRMRVSSGRETSPRVGRCADSPRSCVFGRREWRRRGLAALVTLLAIGGSRLAASEELFDRIEQALTVSASDDRLRARISGLLDLEGYAFSGPAPGLLQTKGETLFSPRLSLFLDAQAGDRAYFFLQARADRGFDPTEGGGRTRLDEYALRLGPWGDARLNLQVGKFATVVGNWTARHTSWTNPFVTAPLPYESLTGIWDSEALRSVETMLRWSHVRPGLAPHLAAIEKSLRIPVVWGPSYATGAAVSGEAGRFLYAVEVKNASLSSRPETWHRFDGYWSHPTVSGRIGYRPSPTWDFGWSVSGGTYLVPGAEATLPAGHDRGDYRQLVLAHDLSFAWRHFQLWTEIYATRFEVPLVGDAETVAYYIEAKYKLTPQLFGALRWNQQFFGHVPDGPNRLKWGRDAWRAEVALGYRFSAHTQLKLQYTLQHGDVDGRDTARLLAAQFAVRF